MKTLSLVIILILTVTIQTFASNNVADNQTDTATDVNMAVAVIAAPITFPSTLLAIPYQGLKSAYTGTEKIQNEAGRNAIRIAMAPFWIPAAVLNIPSALLSPIGLTDGY